MNASNEQLQTATVQGLAKDMKLVGLFTIIYGAVNCLSIIGAVIGVPLIIAGIRCRESAESMMSYLGSRDFNALNRALEQQKSFFNIHKIIYIVGFILFAIFIVFYIVVIGAVISGTFDPANF